MSLDYVARAYGVRFKRGERVIALGEKGRVAGADHCLKVIIDGEKRSRRYHPTDVTKAESAQ